jgi:hypothetical protein
MSALPDTCQPERIADDWARAVTAYRCRDAEGCADALWPELGDAETHTRGIGFAILGASLCGSVVRETSDPNPVGIWTFTTEDMRTGETVNPDDIDSAANEIAAVRMIVAAANRDQKMLSDLALAHLRFDAPPEHTLLIMRLLTFYCQMIEGGA